MLRRQTVKFSAAAATAAKTTFTFAAADADAAATTTTAQTPEQVSVQHSRSSHNYAAFGGDVGARNEAAFIDYQSSQPRNIEEKYALPHKVNLLTVLPILMGAWFIAGVAWGTVLWGAYLTAVPHETVMIQRPAEE